MRGLNSDVQSIRRARGPLGHNHSSVHTISNWYLLVHTFSTYFYISFRDSEAVWHTTWNLINKKISFEHSLCYVLPLLQRWRDNIFFKKFIDPEKESKIKITAGLTQWLEAIIINAIFRPVILYKRYNLKFLIVVCCTTKVGRWKIINL